MGLNSFYNIYLDGRQKTMWKNLLILGILLILLGSTFAFITTTKWDGSPETKEFSVLKPKTTMGWSESPIQFMVSKTEAREDNGFCCG